MGHRFGFYMAHVNVLAMVGVLSGGFAVQFLWQELPCPLCMLQRMAMMLAALGPAYVLVHSRNSQNPEAEMATGYGMSILAAALGATISSRHILLHILPDDPGFGDPVLSLHLYTWAMLVFATVMVVSGVNLLFAREWAPREETFGWLTRLVLAALGVIIAANLVAAFCLEGLHWMLPGSPEKYRLFEDLRR